MASVRKCDEMKMRRVDGRKQTIDKVLEGISVACGNWE
jgi:hypothetical protein